MKKTAILLAVAAILLCVVLAGCGTAENGNTTSSTNGTSTTGNGFMDTTPSEELNTVSEFFSEVASDMGDGSFLDPQNGIISDTQAY